MDKCNKDLFGSFFHQGPPETIPNEGKLNNDNNNNDSKSINSKNSDNDNNKNFKNNNSDKRYGYHNYIPLSISKLAFIVISK